MKIRSTTKLYFNFCSHKENTLKGHMSYKRILEGNKRYVESKLAD